MIHPCTAPHRILQVEPLVERTGPMQGLGARSSFVRSCRSEQSVQAELEKLWMSGRLDEHEVCLQWARLPLGYVYTIVYSLCFRHLTAHIGFGYPVEYPVPSCL